MLRIAFFIIVLMPFAYAEDDLFQKGLAAYQAQKFQEARDDFQKLLGEGQSSPALLHNLALSALQTDQKPLALALWRKALSAQPRFRPAREGRDLLEGKMQMRPFERDSFALWAHRSLALITEAQTLILNALLLGLFGWFGLRHWGARRRALDEEQPLPPFPAWESLAGVLFVASLVLVLAKLHDDWDDRATVIAARATVRSLPADDSVNLFEVGGGSEVIVERQQSGWTQVENSEGNTGWVKDSEILITSER